MDAWWGRPIYWAATIVAALIVLSVIWSYVNNVKEQYPVIPIARLVLAGVIWLVGWAFRYLSRYDN
jgi:hypothetical protein